MVESLVICVYKKFRFKSQFNLNKNSISVTYTLFLIKNFSLNILTLLYSIPLNFYWRAFSIQGDWTQSLSMLGCSAVLKIIYFKYCLGSICFVQYEILCREKRQNKSEIKAFRGRKSGVWVDGSSKCDIKFLSVDKNLPALKLKLV